MYIIAIFIGFGFFLFSEKTIRNFAILMIVNIILAFTILKISAMIQALDTEIWSGVIESVQHKEEYDEWIPPKKEVDSNGKATIVAGHWVHHYAENSIKTSDGGWINVNKSMDGMIKFNDNYPNTNNELAKFYSINSPTASFHSYHNKLKPKQTTSLYKYEGKITDYNLPKYPKSTIGYIGINRAINFNQQTNELLQQINSNLNYVHNKQVNLMFVKFSNEPKDIVYALQDYWNNGNKNDYIVVCIENNNIIDFVHIISWTESYDLNIKVENYLTNQTDSDWDKKIQDIGNLIIDNYTRKEMKDYDYIKIEPTMKTFIFGAIVLIIINLIVYYFIIAKEGYF